MEQDVQNIVYRARLARWFSGVMFALIGSATLLRPLFATLDPTFTYIGVFNTLLMLSVFMLSGVGRFHRFAPALLLSASLLALVPLLAVSGGVNSQFASMAPLYPIVCALLVGLRATALFTAVWMLLILGAGVWSAELPDLTGEPYHEGKTYSRAFWLFMSMIAATIFAFRFDRSLRSLQDKLRRQALQDPLTGLGNRRGFQERFELECARGERQERTMSLLMIDIDHFKRFNDQNGHDGGDACLRAVARCLTENCRQGQDYVARFGGEEFVIILSDTPQSQANAVANKLCHAVEALNIPYEAGGSEMVTVTIGVASEALSESLTAQASADDLLLRADRALYEGKRGGRNRAVLAGIALTESLQTPSG